MLSSELLAEVQRLNRAEKLRLVQLLVNELASEEVSEDWSVEYPIYTPYGNESAAVVLTRLLEEDKHSGGE